jgi:hypothetical protein
MYLIGKGRYASQAYPQRPSAGGGDWIFAAGGSLAA